MSDFNFKLAMAESHGCSEDPAVQCTLHNLHCGWPNCAKGRRDREKSEAFAAERSRAMCENMFSKDDNVEIFRLQEALKQMTSERDYHEEDAKLIREEDDIEFARLNAEIDRLKELLAGGEVKEEMFRVLTCVYCGREYPQNTPSWNDKVLTDHIAQCDKHPMRSIIEERDLLNAEVQRLLKAVVNAYFEGLTHAIEAAKCGAKWEGSGAQRDIVDSIGYSHDE